jgi:outer membrane protein assembly factor BamA
MQGRAAIQYALLAMVCACLGAPATLAQSTPGRGSGCPFGVSCDDFKEMIGQKVFPKVIIDEVTFDGPVSIPPATLDALTKDLTSHEFDGDSKWLGEIEEMSVRAAWQDNGYFRAEVSGKSLLLGGDANFQHYSVTFHVDEGSQYRVGNMTFRSSDPDVPLAFPPGELRKLIPFLEGDLLTAKGVRAGLEALKDFYGRMGYIDFAPEPETDVNVADRVVSIHFVLNQQKQFRIHEVTVCGSNPKFESLMKSKIKSGDIFNYSDIHDFFEKHQSALGGHFGSEKVVYRRDVKNGTVDIGVALRNCPLSQD